MAHIIGAHDPKMPWQDKPEGYQYPVWRYSGNPILKRDIFPFSSSIYNSAVVPFRDGYAGVFRIDDICRRTGLHRGFSKDGLHWEIDENTIPFQGADPEIAPMTSSYDPRVCFIEDRYYITWCNGYHGPTIGVAYTYDFETFTQLENAFVPFNRNGVLFPRKIGGEFYMMSRPSDNAHTKFGDIFVSRSKDMEYWGRHRHVMACKNASWENLKIGTGPTPIETDEGWLLIYHGVNLTCNGMVYYMGAALLDIDQPWVVKHRSRAYIMNPRELYECVGDVPNVVFPCAALTDAATGRIALYYGAADTCVGLAFTDVNTLVDFVKKYDTIDPA